MNSKSVMVVAGAPKASATHTKLDVDVSEPRTTLSTAVKDCVPPAAA